MTVQRARKIERFLSQPFFVAEQFTGTPGQYVPIARDGARRSARSSTASTTTCPSRIFMKRGSIDDVVEAAKKS